VVVCLPPVDRASTFVERIGYNPSAIPSITVATFTSKSARIAFGAYQLDLAQAELRRFNTPIRMQPQPFKLLALLTSRPGEIVTREEIEKEIWGDHTIVDFERGLNHCVRMVRAALGDDADAPRYIETLPRRGYRFIAPVKFVEARPPEIKAAKRALAGETAVTEAPAELPPSVLLLIRRHSGTTAVVAAALLVAIAGLILAPRYNRRPAQAVPAERVMIAVLPFENLTGDSSQDYLCDGVTDETILNLGQLSPAKIGVIARTSAMTFKNAGKPLDQISRELGVEYLLSGTVKRAGSKTRIVTELVRSRDRSQLWAETYEGELSGSSMLQFQESVASRIALSLSLVLPETRVPGQTTASPLAYEAYLRGRYEWNIRNDESFLKATDYFRKAISYDPNYAQAYAGLADCYDLFLEYYERQSAEDFAAMAKNAAETAVRMNPQLSDGHRSLAFNLWRYQWNFAAAEAEFRKALELDPNDATAHHWYGLFLASRGRFEEAREELHLARVLDPLSLIIVTNAGWVDYYAHDFDGAIANYQEALNLDSSFQPALMKLAWAYEQKGMWAEAVAAREKFYVAAGHPSIAQQISSTYSASGYPGVIRAIIAETGKTDAKQEYEDYEIAKLYAFVGDRNQAFAFLERAQDHRSGWLVYLAIEPAFDNLHNDPRFVRLISKTLSKRTN
jgi:TolB-like protein/DNA-binding winged helix-turn-helix (wHTH) protein/Tfp pilus assembly protein PilF